MDLTEYPQKSIISSVAVWFGLQEEEVLEPIVVTGPKDPVLKGIIEVHKSQLSPEASEPATPKTSQEETSASAAKSSDEVVRDKLSALKPSEPRIGSEEADDDEVLEENLPVLSTALENLMNSVK